MRTDERISRTNAAVTSRGFAILSWGLTIILIYRIFALGQEFSEFGDAFILWIAANGYVALASSLRGVQPFGGLSGRLWLVPGIVALTHTGMVISRGATVAEVVVAFAVSFAAALAVLLILQSIYRRWENRNLS
ncbi:MAG: hypothetical protein R6U70_10205 [Bacillota bacterium]